MENKLVVTKGERGGGINLEIETDIHMLLYIKQINKRTYCMPLFFAFLFHEDVLDPCLLYNVTNLCT